MKITKISFNNKKILQPRITDNKIVKPLVNISKKLLTTELAVLSLTGILTSQSCTKDNIEIIKPNFYNNFSGLLTNDIDYILNDLGIIKEPNSSIKEVRTFSFKTDKGENYYLQPLKISNEEIKLKQIKFDQDLSREDSILKITSMNNEILIEQCTEEKNSTIKLVRENGLTKIYTQDNNLWIEHSTVEKCDDEYFILKSINGESKIFYDIKNNIEMPQDIYFEPVEEIEDEVIF